ncbi:MAG: hypothetical protein GXO56_03505 [Chloroflexi bacterium]|nr:hypothetical protein [Chloroflexota bacterium]
MQHDIRWIPIYTTGRNLAAFLGYPYLFDTKGRWIGFVTPAGEVFSIHGEYVGQLEANPRAPRILRHVETAALHPPETPPPPPDFAPQTNMTVPLPPAPSKPPAGTVDVLLTMPELLPPYEE